ncbi:DUF2357 domain-containing protein [Paenibacillus sacheonensis]|uniref:DUF2357 domain-containing protein n=1 Tax=Paenibacillus sacheonensis TaxID=742054 RepID=A0A7X4YP98_9BACL|nr:DUF2357 domain-containing protein [Paenibacillus sacheonensis]MBM7565258.1 hypothetical protein [Paenibacillus sacheonensis]NBC69968.1 DUF2357 domain-containing protein [Paenibacillus sacheonensis]
MASLYRKMVEAVKVESIELSVIKDNDKKESVHDFYTSEAVIEYNPSFELVENKYVSILFNTRDKNARLYMYGLESLEDDRLEYDESGDVYLKPSNTPLALYFKDYYPLIPGTYLATLVADGERYYIPFIVHAKQLTNNELELMKKELEATVRGLAIDFVKKVYNASDSATKAIPPQLLRHFMIIKKHYPSVMAALTDIFNKANFKTRKQYRWTNENRSNKVDQVTMRALQTKSGYDGHLLTPYSAIDYDLPENRWVKFIVRNVLSLLDQFDESLRSYKVKLSQEIVDLRIYASFQESTRRELSEKERVIVLLENYAQLVHRMKIGFQMINHAPWFDEITYKPFTHIPHNLLLDSRYRALYQLHRDIKEEEVEISLDPSFTYQWKRTDKLYEMWGYLHLLKLLCQIGFEPKSGWMYDNLKGDELFLIPHMASGERIILTKNDLSIQFVYDGVIPLAGSATNLEGTPLYMGKNNRPDGRLDFYQQNVYVGSLIVDFKYRPVSNFWVNSKHNSITRQKEMEQLIAYKRDSNSRFLYGEGQRAKNFRETFSPRPVREVWAIYAEPRMEYRNQSFIHDDSIRIIPMNPGQNFDEIIANLQLIISFMENVKESI